MIGFSELRAQAWRIAAAVGGVLAVALLIACLFLRNTATRATVRADAERARAEASEARVRALNEVIETERAAAKRANAIAAQYEQDKINAGIDAKRTIADLRAGNIQLRAEWQGCKAGLPQADGTPSESDAVAEQRIQGASDLVRIGREADAQIKGLQEFIRSERSVEK